MVAFRFNNVCIESFCLKLPSNKVTSADLEDRIAPVYERLKIPFGTLEKASGVFSRYLWDIDYGPSSGATEAGKEALSNIGFDRSNVQALLNCSVTRDYFEPATACIVAKNLEIPEQGMAFDITNACIGFSNGILMMSNLIESGVIKSGIVVAAENISPLLETSIKKLLEKKDINREELLKILPVFTLGCGAAAMVLCHESIATKNHHIRASVARSATQHVELCQGNGDYCVFQESELDPLMYTDAYEIVNAASDLGSRVWPELSELIGWSSDDIDHLFCHQIGKQVNDNFYSNMGLDIKKEYAVYRELGNLVSASLPAAFFLGAEKKEMQKDDKVVLTAYGSGLNAIFTAIEW